MMYEQNAKNRIRESLKSSNLVFIVFFFLTLILYSQCQIRVGTDDTINLEIINEVGVLKWLYIRSTNWQPRIFCDLFFGIVRDNRLLWSVISSIMTTVTVIIVSKIAMLKNSNDEIKIYVNVLICSLYFAIYPFTLNSATFWYYGSVNYAWLLPMLLFAMYPYILEINELEIKNKLVRVAIILASIVISYSESTFAIIFCFGTVILAIRKIQKKKVSKYLLFNLLMVAINGFIFILFTIRAGRLDKEIHWYPDFPMLTRIDKIFQGINWTNYYYINSINLIMWILMIVLFLGVYLNKNRNKFMVGLFSLPLLYMTLNILPFSTVISNFNKNNFKSELYWGNLQSYFWGEKQHDLLFNTMYANPSNIEYSYKALLPSFLGMIFIMSILILFFLRTNKVEDFIINSLLYSAAIMSGYIMILSPTIFASGVRIFFIGSVFIIIIIAKYFVELFSKGIRKRNVVIGLSIIVLITIPLYLQLLFIISKMTEIL